MYLIVYVRSFIYDKEIILNDVELLDKSDIIYKYSYQTGTCKWMGLSLIDELLVFLRRIISVM